MIPACLFNLLLNLCFLWTQRKKVKFEAVSEMSFFLSRLFNSFELPSGLSLFATTGTCAKLHSVLDKCLVLVMNYTALPQPCHRSKLFTSCLFDFGVVFHCLATHQ